MRPRLNIRNIALAWALLLFGAALILPNLDLHTRSYPLVKVLLAAYWLLLLIGTPVAFFSYFNRAWRNADAVPNRGSYVTWLSLESIAAIAFLVMLFYATLSAVLKLR
jgi:hypothetical protein